MPPQTSTPETSVPTIAHTIAEPPFASPPSGSPAMGAGSIATCANAPSAGSAGGRASAAPVRLSGPAGHPGSPGGPQQAPPPRHQGACYDQDGEGHRRRGHPAAADVRQAERGAREHSRPEVHQEHGLAVRVADLSELVVDVRLVRRENG